MNDRNPVKHTAKLIARWKCTLRSDDFSRSARRQRLKSSLPAISLCDQFSCRSRSRLAPILFAVFLVAVASAACSPGGPLGGGQNAGATPTRLRRATFTPLPGALGTQAAGAGVVRGTLPPGVTVEAVGGSNFSGTPGAVAAAGDTSLLIYATDTPTPSPIPTQEPPTSTPAGLPTQAETQPTPYVVIKPATLNGHRGPGTEYERVGQAKQGQELFVLGRTADGKWLEVCCLANQPVWVLADQVESKGDVELAAILTPAPVPLPTPTRRPVAAAPRTGQSPIATPTPAGTPLPPFDIARGPEFPITRDNGLMTIWVKIYEGPPDNQAPLGGYVLKVKRDGVDISDNEQSFGNDRPFDNTGKFQGNYDYNLKFEVNDASESDYEIYLARPNGFRVSPITKFTTKGTSYRTLVVYMAYWLAR
jgi:hypothetical protein